jgi:hypothetical protein
MNKSSIYNCQFLIKKVNVRSIPLIQAEIDVSGMLHTEMAKFIQGCDIWLAEEIVSEINGLNLVLRESSIVNYQIEGGYNDMIEVSSPDIVSFTDTNSRIINYPVDDFLGLLQEWIYFLKSIPT